MNEHARGSLVGCDQWEEQHSTRVDPAYLFTDIVKMELGGVADGQGLSGDVNMWERAQGDICRVI